MKEQHDTRLNGPQTVGCHYFIIHGRNALLPQLQAPKAKASVDLATACFPMPAKSTWMNKPPWTWRLCVLIFASLQGHFGGMQATVYLLVRSQACSSDSTEMRLLGLLLTLDALSTTFY
eukprot:1144000-Pelagomonas_calceolata.AAC.2